MLSEAMAYLPGFYQYLKDSFKENDINSGRDTAIGVEI